MTGEDWLPIATAPKDGTKLRARYADGSVEDGVYWEPHRFCMLGPPQGSRGEGWNSTEAGHLPVEGIEAWQPLPAPPGQSS